MRQFFALVCLLIATVCNAQVECPLVAEIPHASTLLWSSVMDPIHGRYFVSREQNSLRVFEVLRGTSLQVQERFSIPLSSDLQISVAFSQGALLLSQWRRTSGSGDNLTTGPLATIQAFRLSDGQPDPTRSIGAATRDILPAQQNSAPFYSSQWTYRSWQTPLCAGTNQPNSQQGRIIAAANDKIFIAHNA